MGRVVRHRRLVVWLAVASFATGACNGDGDGSAGLALSLSPTTTPILTATTTTGRPDALPRALPANLDARGLLDLIDVQNEHQTGYKRDLFGGEWIEQPDCLDTRGEVLARDSETEAARTGCKVTAGTWTSPYDGVTTADPAGLQIDHLVPLKEAWDSGAWQWSGDERLAFANDLTYPHALMAVSSATNESKGDRDPSNWLPPLESIRCQYVSWFTAQKWRWSLSMDQSEWGRIKNVMAKCEPSTLTPE